MFQNVLENVRKKFPLIHNIANYVTLTTVQMLFFLEEHLLLWQRNWMRLQILLLFVQG